MSEEPNWKKLDAEEIAKLIHLVMDQGEISTREIMRYAAEKFKVPLTPTDIKLIMWSLSPDVDSFDITWIPYHDIWKWAGTKRQSLLAIRREIRRQLQLMRLNNLCLSCRNYTPSGLCKVRGQKRTFISACKIYEQEK